MRDRASWFYFGIGSNKVGDLKVGRWEYFLGPEGPLDYHVAIYWLRNAGFTFTDADSYLKLLRDQWL